MAIFGEGKAPAFSKIANSFASTSKNIQQLGKKATAHRTLMELAILGKRRQRIPPQPMINQVWG